MQILIGLTVAVVAIPAAIVGAKALIIKISKRSAD